MSLFSVRFGILKFRIMTEWFPPLSCRNGAPKLLFEGLESVRHIYGVVLGIHKNSIVVCCGRDLYLAVFPLEVSLHPFP